MSYSTRRTDTHDVNPNSAVSWTDHSALRFARYARSRGAARRVGACSAPCRQGRRQDCAASIHHDRALSCQLCGATASLSAQRVSRASRRLCVPPYANAYTKRAFCIMSRFVKKRASALFGSFSLSHTKWPFCRMAAYLESVKPPTAAVPPASAGGSPPKGASAEASEC